MEILFVEDESSLNHAVSLKLRKEGYCVYSAENVKTARALYRAHDIKLIICDVGLPDGNGLEFCKEIRKDSSVLFLFLTALDTEEDMIKGYDAGGDDYITKPFSLEVLVSKVNAITARWQQKKNAMKSGDITWFMDENRIIKAGDYLNLTANEQKLLIYFMQNSGRILSKNQLLDAIWDIDGSFVDDNTVAVNIRRLREKIEENPSNPVYIKNVRGLGYIWNEATVSVQAIPNSNG